MEQPDSVIHQPTRLKIMAALKALPPREQLEFMRLKALVGLTDGNLGAQIVTLEQSGYVEVEKDFVGKKPRTRVRLTKDGRRAFENYISFLREIVGRE
ncbi:MAG: winged helix-turn-helix domain-containing protein [Candidatus Acidiferrales bacterium]